MNRRIAKAHVVVGLMTALAWSLAPRGAYADDTPTADATHLTPPEAAPPPSHSTSVSAASGGNHLLQASPEVLSGANPRRTAAFIFGGVAVVGVGVGTVFGVLAINAQNNFNGQQTPAHAASANEEAVIADVALGAAVIAGVTSVVLFLRKDPPPGASPTTSGARPRVRAAQAMSFTVAPIVTQHGGGAGALLSF